MHLFSLFVRIDLLATVLVGVILGGLGDLGRIHRLLDDLALLALILGGDRLGHPLHGPVARQVVEGGGVGLDDLLDLLLEAVGRVLRPPKVEDLADAAYMKIFRVYPGFVGRLRVPFWQNISYNRINSQHSNKGKPIFDRT